MIVALIISVVGFVAGVLVMSSAILYDWKGWIYNTATIITGVFSITMIVLTSYISGVKQNSPKEYPASEYTFKIKVVEFEEQRDTILVIIPKDK